MILARDDVFYWLKREAYDDGAHGVDTSMVGQARELVSQGVVLADIPVGSIPGVGAMCYLVNLSGIRTPVRIPPTSPPEGRPVFNPAPLDPNDPCLNEPTPAADDLVIADRDGTRFFWVKKCEYQRAECELRQADPELDRQVRLLTDNGVVLADIPAGSSLGVDEMGCLVNLSGIHRPDAKTALEPPPAPTPKPAGA